MSVSVVVAFYYIDLWGPISARRKQFSRLHTKSITREIWFSAVSAERNRWARAPFSVHAAPPAAAAGNTALHCVRERWNKLPILAKALAVKKSRSRTNWHSNQSKQHQRCRWHFILYIYIYTLIPSHAFGWNKFHPGYRRRHRSSLEDPPDAATAIKPSHCLERTLSKRLIAKNSPQDIPDSSIYRFSVIFSRAIQNIDSK